MTEVIFHRASTKEGKSCPPFFYFVDLPAGHDSPSDVAEHVRLNPGTVRVENAVTGEVLFENEAA